MVRNGISVKSSLVTMILKIIILFVSFVDKEMRIFTIYELIFENCWIMNNSLAKLYVRQVGRLEFVFERS